MQQYEIRTLNLITRSSLECNSTKSETYYNLEYKSTNSETFLKDHRLTCSSTKSDIRSTF